jgi:hypothetical protein
MRVISEQEDLIKAGVSCKDAVHVADTSNKNNRPIQEPK